MGIDLYEIFLEVEDEFDIRFEEADMASIVTVGSLFDASLSALLAQHPERFEARSEYADEAWEQLRALIVLQLGVEQHQVVKSAHFVSDLGCL